MQAGTSTLCGLLPKAQPMQEEAHILQNTLHRSGGVHFLEVPATTERTCTRTFISGNGAKKKIVRCDVCTTYWENIVTNTFNKWPRSSIEVHQDKGRDSQHFQLSHYW